METRGDAVARGRGGKGVVLTSNVLDDIGLDRCETPCRNPAFVGDGGAVAARAHNHGH